MKLFIVGANGQIGQQLVKQALEAGHEVTAFVRQRGSLSVDNPKLSVVTGDIVRDYSKLAEHLAGHDAVVSTLGNGLLVKGKGGSKIMEAALTNLSKAMLANNTKRIVLVFSYGSGKTLQFANFPIQVLAKTFFRKDFKDLTAAENIITNSELDLDWTIGYFGALSDTPLSSQYSISSSLHTPGKLLIARADVAHFLLTTTVNQSFVKQRVVLSGAESREKKGK